MVWGHVNIMGVVGPEGCQLSVWGGAVIQAAQEL